MPNRRARARSAGAYQRRDPVRQPYDVVLIVCEGQKTEPNYFKGLRIAYSLSSTNIQIVPPEYGNDPLSVVRFAEDRLVADAEIDKAYCVIDRDTHANFDAAVNRVNQSEAGRSGKLSIIDSTPCFEFWILLHFVFTAQPFVHAADLSGCDMVIRSLRGHIPDYSKNRPGLFAELSANLETALIHAERLERENEESGANNPATRLHYLVRYLRGLRGN